MQGFLANQLGISLDGGKLEPVPALDPQVGLDLRPLARIILDLDHFCSVRWGDFATLFGISLSIKAKEGGIGDIVLSTGAFG